jgi:hypothetical protein
MSRLPFTERFISYSDVIPTGRTINLTLAQISLSAGAEPPAVLRHQLVEDHRELFQPGKVSCGQPLHDAVARLAQADPHHAAVARIRYPFDEARRLGPVNELHGAVRTLEQVAGQFADGGREVARVSLDRYEQLMLDVSEAGGLRLVFAPALEAPQGDTELQQPLEVTSGRPGHHHLPSMRESSNKQHEKYIV